jgi:hypothetical protein
MSVYGNKGESVEGSGRVGVEGQGGVLIRSTRTGWDIEMPDAEPFTSMLSIDLDREVGPGFDKERVHVVYGMSKDFCANGFR